MLRYRRPAAGWVCLALAICAIWPAPRSLADPAEPRPVASIQDLMIYEVDAAADYLWETVGTIVTAQGTEVRQPRTDEDWQATAREAVILTEAANLLMLESRRITDPGRQIADEGVDGVLTTAQAQAAIDGDREGFNAFANALQANGVRMMSAVEARDPAALMAAGDSLDAICEGCHMRFWYPNQVIPTFPEELSGRAP